MILHLSVRPPCLHSSARQACLCMVLPLLKQCCCSSGKHAAGATVLPTFFWHIRPWKGTFFARCNRRAVHFCCLHLHGFLHQACLSFVRSFRREKRAPGLCQLLPQALLHQAGLGLRASRKFLSSQLIAPSLPGHRLSPLKTGASWQASL